MPNSYKFSFKENVPDNNTVITADVSIAPVASLKADSLIIVCFNFLPIFI